LAGENAVWKQGVVWLANVFSLLLIYTGCRLRGETFQNFGFSLQFQNWKDTGRILGLSLLIFIAAIAGFMVGSIVMANIMGIPEGASLHARVLHFSKNQNQKSIITNHQSQITHHKSPITNHSSLI
jgi:hypothetical protein